MKSFVKNNIKFIIVIVICVVSSSITTLATNYIFNSNEVSYDNTESGLHADEVQGAIDEVFQHATDYSEIKNTIGTGSLTTTSNTLIGGVNEVNGKIPSVINNLTSTSTTAALSAAQGKVLNNKISDLEGLRIGYKKVQVTKNNIAGNSTGLVSFSIPSYSNKSFIGAFIYTESFYMLATINTGSGEHYVSYYNISSGPQNLSCTVVCLYI